MKKVAVVTVLGMLPFILSAQTGHIMQGIGATNMSMGGASTAQPIDINGALQEYLPLVQKYFPLMQGCFILHLNCLQRFLPQADQ